MITISRNLVSINLRLYMMQWLIFLNQILCTILSQLLICFRNVHRLLKFKTHLHHSHITGEILGYTHDIWNWTVHENKSQVATITHNLFGFDKFFLIKEYRATVWGMKHLNIGGTNLTHINYGYIGGEIKYIARLSTIKNV